jgi:hypothetical protein
VTIIASVKVRDGLILATDSMSHIYGGVPGQQQEFLKAYENARKLFQIGDLPIGVMSYGIGNVGQRSIEGLMLDFADVVESRKGVKAVAKALYDFIKEHYDREFGEAGEPPTLGFYLAGYSPKAPFPEEWEFLLPRDAAPFEARPEDVFGASWRGVDIPFTRLWMGFDPRLFERLKQHGLSDEQIREMIEDLETPAIYTGMPVQDAINFATYILNATIGYSGFSIGVPVCGGPLQVATILADRGFAWIARPDLRVSGST